MNPDDKNFVPEDQMTAEQQQEIAAAEDFVLAFKDEDFADPDKLEEYQKNQALLKTTIHQKRHFRSKVKELTKPAEPAAPAAPAKPAEPAAPENAEEKSAVLEFRQDHPTLPKDLVTQIFAYAKTVGKKPDEVMDDAVVKSMIAVTEKKKDVDDASIQPGPAQPATVETKDWSQASEKEINAARARMGV